MDKNQRGYITHGGGTNERNCYVTLAFSGIPERGYKITSSYISYAFSRAHKWAELLPNPCILGVPKRGQIHKWAASLGGFKVAT